MLEKIELEEQINFPERPPNLFEYMIARGEPIRLGEIQIIAKDILQSLSLIHSKNIAHLDLNPMNLLVIDNIQPMPLEESSHNPNSS